MKQKLPLVENGSKVRGQWRVEESDGRRVGWKRLLLRLDLEVKWVKGVVRLETETLGGGGALSRWVTIFGRFSFPGVEFRSRRG